MRRALAVTALAGHAFAAIDERQPVVRIVGKTLYDLFVTGRAKGGVYQVARIRLRPLEACGMRFAWLSHNRCSAKHHRAQQPNAVGSRPCCWRFYRQMGD